VVGAVRAAVVAGGYNDILEGVPAEGLEPTRSCDHWILSPARLPVPPRRLRRQIGASYRFFLLLCYFFSTLTSCKEMKPQVNLKARFRSPKPKIL
jgi:hypothetical protein